MKPVSGKDFAKALTANGWQLDHIRGSHHYFVKDGVQVMPCVPIHGNKTLRTGLQASLMKQTGITDADL
jgi:predicted RNA binding protein YcfA (HicA-like mRNA interferase family)